MRMLLVGRFDQTAVKLRQLKTDAAGASNTNGALTIDLTNQERPLMLQSILSPASTHPHVGTSQIGGR